MAEVKLTRRLFAGYQNADAMFYYCEQAFARRFDEAGAVEELPGLLILTSIVEVAEEMTRIFQADKDALIQEISDFLDATIWAEIPGGVLDPLPGQRPNRFVR